MMQEGNWGQWHKPTAEADALTGQETEFTLENQANGPESPVIENSPVEKLPEEVYPGLKAKIQDRVQRSLQSSEEKLQAWEQAMKGFETFDSTDGMQLSAKEKYFRLKEYGSPHSRYEYFQAHGGYSAHGDTNRRMQLTVQEARQELSAIWDAEINAMSPAEKEAVDRIIGAKHAIFKALEVYRENVKSYQKARHDAIYAALSPEDQEYFEKYQEYPAGQAQSLDASDFFRARMEKLSKEPVADEESGTWAGDDLPNNNPVGDEQSDELPPQHPVE